MSVPAWLQIAVTVIAIFLLSIPTGRYMARIVMGQKTIFDRFFDPIDNAIYFLIGRRVTEQAMTWKAYTYHMLATNLVMALLIFVVYSFQDHLPLNQLGFPRMEALQAFNTAISFITNTNWQSYSGETTLSNFSQMGGITFPMFTSATTGFVVAMAWIRAFTVTNGGADLGNFYRDFIRFITRVLLPICCVIALVMVSQGAVQTLDASIVAHAVQGGDQTIIVGPVASQGTIELVGTNGGGFYNVNAAHPFQNPTPITNVILIVLMALLPAAIVVTFGEMVGNRRQAGVLYGVMGTLMVLLLLLCVMPEQGGTPMLRHAGIETTATVNQPGGNMEGKEVRFGIAGSSLFADITTAFTTGAVDSAHDSYTPLPGISMFGQMMLQCVFGGKGVGFLNGLMYGLIAVFVAGLMVGRTPEFLGKKIETQEIILVSLALLIHPLVILSPTGWSMLAPYALSSLGNNGIHGYEEVLYAFTSGAADNGSAFAGLSSNTPWFNLAIAAVIFIGRYPPIIFLMGVAGSVARKRTTPPTTSTLRTDTVMFGVFWFATILIVGALTFFPALVLGPIAEFFAMKAGLTF
ncbi:MAG: potassium-transporting ATPase subunit KdpA [Xanthobacteraceae bacterium]|jgi:K+-transporting ATPase ATPase A chain